MLASQKSQRPVARYLAIECDLARSSIRVRGERPPKERLRSGNAPIRSQHEVDAAPLLVHDSVQIVPFALDRDVSLVNAPGTTDRGYCQVNGETAEARRSNGKCQPFAGSEQPRQAGAAGKKALTQH